MERGPNENSDGNREGNSCEQRVKEGHSTAKITIRSVVSQDDVSARTFLARGHLRPHTRQDLFPSASVSCNDAGNSDFSRRVNDYRVVELLVETRFVDECRFNQKVRLGRCPPRSCGPAIDFPKDERMDDTVEFDACVCVSKDDPGKALAIQ